MLPLAGGAGDELEAVGHVLCERHLHGVDNHLCPGVVLFLGDDAAVGIDAAEAAEGLVGTRRVDAVDVDLGEIVVVAAVRRGDADADLAGELAVEAHREFVQPGLVQVLGEEQARVDAARGGRVHLGAVPVLVDVDVGDVDGAGLTKGDDVVAAVDLFVEPAVAGANDVAGVLGDQIRDPGAGLHGGALLPVDVRDGVVALDEVDAQADVGRQPRRRRVGVLQVERKIAVVFTDRRRDVR